LEHPRQILTTTSIFAAVSSTEPAQCNCTPRSEILPQSDLGVMTVLICYRSQDYADYAAPLQRELVRRFGSRHVSLDAHEDPDVVVNVPPRDSPLPSAAVMLVMLSPHWRNASDHSDAMVPDDPRDTMRMTIARALRAPTSVIPVLVGGVKLPSADRLPQDLRALSSRNALTLRESNWEEDFRELLQHVHEGIYAHAASGSAESMPDPKSPALSTPPWRPAVGFAMMIAMGLFFIALGAAQTISQLKSGAASMRSVAQVTTIVLKRSADGTTYAYPEIEFKTADGRSVRTTLDWGSSPSAYEPGDELQILYDPLAPDHVQANSFVSRWLINIILLAAGTLFAGAGLIPSMLAVKEIRRIRRLRRSGKRIATIYHSTEPAPPGSSESETRFYIVTEWRNPESAHLVYFRSNALSPDPTDEVLMHQIITAVVDPNAIGNYALDLSFLTPDTAPTSGAS
jgi:hypothetical protein